MNIINEEKEINAERRLRYEYLALEVRAIKNHQWTITYYTNIIFAGLIGFDKAMGSAIGNKGAFILFILAFVILFHGILRIILSQVDLSRYRKWLIEIENTFFTKREIDSFRKRIIRKGKSLIDKRYFQPIYYIKFWGFFVFSFVISFTLITWYLKKPYCLLNGINTLFKLQ